jgi:hypothetical protein
VAFFVSPLEACEEEVDVARTSSSYLQTRIKQISDKRILTYLVVNQLRVGVGLHLQTFDHVATWIKINRITHPLTVILLSPVPPLPPAEDPSPGAPDGARDGPLPTDAGPYIFQFTASPCRN